MVDVYRIDIVAVFCRMSSSKITTTIRHRFYGIRIMIIDVSHSGRSGHGVRKGKLK